MFNGTNMRNVMDFGARGDGITNDTAAIQRAIDAGGVVCFPPGTYLAGTLFLKSDGGLHLEAGSVLKASPERKDYNRDDLFPQNFSAPMEHAGGAHFIIALEQENISLSGSGRIDGNRQAFYGTKEEPGCGEDNRKFPKSELECGWRPAQMVYFVECKNINISGLQLYNSPYWSCFLHGCEDVQIRGLRILNDQRTRNGDGIDIDCCCRVTVADCIIDSGDDCITLRGSDARLKNPRHCEYITVTNCILHTNCNALRIGVGNGVVRNALFSNIICGKTRTGIAIISNYLSSAETGVQIENISFENFQMEVEQPFLILSRVHGASEIPAAKMIKNITFRNIRGTFKRHNPICGSGNTGIDNISFENIELECKGSALPHDDNISAPYGEWTKTQTRGAFYLAHARNVHFDRVRIAWGNHPEWKFGIVTHRSRNIELNNCRIEKPDNAAQLA